MVSEWFLHCLLDSWHTFHPYFGKKSKVLSIPQVLVDAVHIGFTFECMARLIYILLACNLSPDSITLSSMSLKMHFLEKNHQNISCGFLPCDFLGYLFPWFDLDIQSIHAYILVYEVDIPKQTFDNQGNVSLELALISISFFLSGDNGRVHPHLIPFSTINARWMHPASFTLLHIDFQN